MPTSAGGRRRPAGTQPVQGACGITLGRVVDHVDAGDEPHLVEIRCHHRCDREQDGAQRIQGSGRQGGSPCIDAHTGSATSGMAPSPPMSRPPQASTTASMIALDASIPVLAAPIPMSVTTLVI